MKEEFDDTLFSVESTILHIQELETVLVLRLDKAKRTGLITEEEWRHLLEAIQLNTERLEQDYVRADRALRKHGLL